MDFRDTWLIIPCYNEGPIIGEVIAAARRTFPNIVAVNDGSKDDSATAIHQAGAHLINHPVNLGQGAGLQTGIEYARAQPGAQFFVTFDADGQHQVKDAMRMIHRLRTEPLDIVVGSRFAKNHDQTGEQQEKQVPLLKRLVLKTAVAFSPTTRKLGLSDAHNGLRAFNKKVAHEINIRMNGMSHASEIVGAIAEQKWRVAEEPVEILYTDYSKSKGQSLINGVNILADNLLARRL